MTCLDPPILPDVDVTECKNEDEKVVCRLTYVVLLVSSYLLPTLLMVT